MFQEVALSTLKVTTMVMFVTLGAILFGGVFMALNGATTIGSLIIALPLGKWGIFTVMMIALFMLGMFIDWIGILFIVVPVFTPVALSVGFDPLWFAIVVCVNLQMSFMTPPFSYAIFYLKGVSPPEVEASDIMKGVLPFIAVQMIVVALVTIFPQIILWLPSVAG
jgi:TRAP-type mannitol/chloroaromatic compound transport system permease large subunit